MKKNIRSSRNRLDRIRLNLLKAQIHNIYNNVPFYRETFKKLNLVPEDFEKITDIEKLPVVTKEDIRDNPEYFFNERMDIAACFKSHTSGSTGQPFQSYFDRRCWFRKKYLSKLRARFACGMRVGDKVAIFESEPLKKVELLNRSHLFRDFFLKVHFFSIFENMEASMKGLFAFKPQNAYGPPSYFFHLARMLKDRRKSVSFLKRIYTSSEFPEGPVIKFIRNVLHVETFDVYGSTEFKEVAWECDRHQGYHINEDEIICEILNNAGPARPGEEGDIVLTDLLNRAMPLIRYRIKDRGKILKEDCRCGRTFLLMQPLSGRASEYIRLPNGEKLPPSLLTTSIEKCRGLLQYQFVQKTQKDLFVNVVLTDGVGEDAISVIEKTIRDVTQGLMRIRVQKNQRISIEDNGKFKVVKNLLPEKAAR